MLSLVSSSQPSATSNDEGEAHSLIDAVSMCRNIAGRIRAESFSLFFTAVHGEARRLVPVFDETFPGVSPVTRRLSGPDTTDFVRLVSTTTCPLWWRGNGAPTFLDAQARVWTREVAPSLTKQSGIAFPVANDRRRLGAIIFTGNEMKLDEELLCDTHAECFDLFAQVAKLREQECNAQRPMSKRELECLRLTANGLTSDEIATALGLSVHTANQYLTNSTQKLNAMNRIHAVAKALRSGMIA